MKKKNKKYVYIGGIIIIVIVALAFLSKMGGMYSVTSQETTGLNNYLIDYVPIGEVASSEPAGIPYKEGFFSKLFSGGLFSVTAKTQTTSNGMSCDSTPSGTPTVFQAKATSINVGTNCNTNAKVVVSTCTTSSSCSSSGYIAYKIGGTSPSYSGFVIGNYYMYKCYTCKSTSTTPATTTTTTTTPTTTTTTTDKCTDTDGGNNKAVAGKITYTTGLGATDHTTKTASDFCSNIDMQTVSTGDYQMEYYCNGNIAYGDYSKCPNGCSNNICNPSSTSGTAKCIDAKTYCKNAILSGGYYLCDTADMTTCNGGCTNNVCNQQQATSQSGYCLWKTKSLPFKYYCSSSTQAGCVATTLEEAQGFYTDKTLCDKAVTTNSGVINKYHITCSGLACTCQYSSVGEYTDSAKCNADALTQTNKLMQSGYCLVNDINSVSYLNPLTFLPAYKNVTSKKCVSNYYGNCPSIFYSTYDACNSIAKVANSLGTTTKPLKIIFSEIKTSTNTIVRGGNYVISGKATIQGTCTNCIIETGFDKYGIWQGFSTTSQKVSSSGVCDDKTVGIKIASANDGDIIQFTFTDYPKFEIDGASKLEGQYNIRVVGYTGCGGSEVGSDSSAKITILPPSIVQSVTTSSGKTTVLASSDISSTVGKLECWTCNTRSGELEKYTFTKYSSCSQVNSRMFQNKEDITDCKASESTASTTEGTDKNNVITVCGSCQDGKLASINYPGSSCPEGTKEGMRDSDCAVLDPSKKTNNPESPGEVPAQTCATNASLCKSGTSEQSSIGSFFSSVFDFKNNPGQAYAVTALLIIIVGGLILLFIPIKKSGNVVKLQ